jgi:hypothetical protein
MNGKDSIGNDIGGRYKSGYVRWVVVKSQILVQVKAPHLATFLTIIMGNWHFFPLF